MPFRQQSRTAITDKLIRNGYHSNFIAKSSRPRHRRDPPQPQQLVLRLPFISDKVNGMIRGALRKSGITARLVNPRPPTVLSIGKRRKPNKASCSMKECPVPYLKCTTPYVVYEAKCEICNETYIGSTSRPIHFRAREHITAATKRNLNSALGEHYRKHVNSSPRIRFSILCKSPPDELRLRISEAYEIKSRNPALNRRREDMGTGFLA